MDSRVQVTAGESDHHPRPFPVSRYVCYDDYRFYYGYGNTPPDDYLENASPRNTEPNILILGCGDIRSCLYTLWKNFDSLNVHSNRFDGVHFVLNDCSAAVLARDVIFLHLCLKTPKEKEEVKEWLCAVWAIWFCHELLPKHMAVLNEALSYLINIATSIESWSSDSNPLHSLVKFTCPRVLNEIRRVWKVWHRKDVQSINTVADMHSSRRKERSTRCHMDANTIASNFVNLAVGSSTSNIPKVVQTCMKTEVSSYLESGSAFVEEILNVPIMTDSRTVVNFTLYEREDGYYTLHYSSVPFMCFFHSFHHSKTIAPQKQYMLVSSRHFETCPFLANSMQQFGLWIQTCATLLTQENGPNVSFTLHCSDAIEFCQILQTSIHSEIHEVAKTFDLIYTSNLVDHLAPPNLILTALPLLKPSGYLFTVTQTYKAVGASVEEYIKACFGFESKLLPILFGIRCINHEGSNYSSTVAVQPLSISAGLVEQWPKLLIWEKVNAQPQKISSLDGESVVTYALSSSVCLCATTLLVCMKGCATKNNLCIETAIKILQTYALTLDSDVSSYKFWSPLCDQLLQDQTIKPFLHALQTQCILHNLHLHLMVNEETCPICKGIHFSEHICKCSLKVSLSFKGMNRGTPCFMIFVHRTQITSAEKLRMVLATDGDAHAFDCLTGRKEANTLTLSFYCPQNFMKKGYTVTLVRFLIGKVFFVDMNIPQVVSHMILDDCCSPLSSTIHSFQNTSCSVTPAAASRFGCVVSHFGDGDGFKTLIQLSNVTVEAGTAVSVKQISSSEIEISCGVLEHRICYPHPIEYNKLQIQVSRRKQNVTVIAPRMAHKFEQENVLFHVNPTNKLSLPPIEVVPETSNMVCGFQYTKQEQETMNSCKVNAAFPPMISLKQTIGTLFQCQNRFFFHITVPDSFFQHRVLISIQNYIFDVQHMTPAINLAFCSLKESFADKLMKVWNKVSNSNSKAVPITEDQYELLAKALNYFSSRTVGKINDSKDEGQFKLLAEQGVDRYFTRAVVYPLYSDPDTYAMGFDFTKSVHEQVSSFNANTTSDTETTSKHCAQCGLKSDDLKTCSKCSKVRYCGRECQRKHWKEHKPNCYKTHDPISMVLPSTPSSHKSSERIATKCSQCGIHSDNLKKCTGCGQVHYCNRQCQEKHWLEHKTNCYKLRSSKEITSETAGSNTGISLSSTKTNSSISVVCEDKCTQCGVKSAYLKKCTKCGKVQYCDKECQWKNWKEHKLMCQSSVMEVTATCVGQQEPLKSCSEKNDILSPSSPPPFPIPRYIYNGKWMYYYGYGNTPPDDYLENVSGITEPKLLLLGSGDIRSCLYTLWKNFDGPSNNFSGVHFVLNDRSAAVLARNVLFLYLCLKTPREKQHRREWLCAVWAIWFCHELLPKHEAILNDALNSLISFSSDIKLWTSRDNPLHSLVKLTCTETLSEINGMWKMWHDKDVHGVGSVTAMHHQRMEQQAAKNFQKFIIDGTLAFNLVTEVIGAQKPLSSELKECMKSEVNSYYTTGSAFIEQCFGPLSDYIADYSINYTLYERSDGVYTLHYASIPFKCFYHSFQFTLKQLKEIKAPKSIFDLLIMNDSHFKTHPILANSAQQFALWFQSCAQVLSQENTPNITFTIHCSDAIEFCQVLQGSSHLQSLQLQVENEFDLIYTSNLIDYLSPANLVLSAISLLKPSGYLFTLTLQYKLISLTAEEYIQACFGFDVELLPILFGIRCINHEGRKYASSVQARSAPLQLSSVTKLLIWEKVKMSPQKLSDLSDHFGIISALCHSFSLTATRLLASKRQYGYLDTVESHSTETFIAILNSFAAVLDVNVSDYQFWSPLSKHLLQEDNIKPLLHTLQTQCILHQFHVHLTVTDETCPICSTTSSIAKFIHQFSLEVNLLPLKSRQPRFLVFIHKSDCIEPQHLCLENLLDEDIHIFDCLTESVERNKLILSFYCPLSFANKGYNVTLVEYTVEGEGEYFVGIYKNIPSVFICKQLRKCDIGTIAHTFQRPESLITTSTCSMGNVVLHFGDSNNYKTIIMLNDIMLSSYTSVTSVIMKQISSSEVEIICGSLRHRLSYPYPIEYNRLSLKISKKHKSMTILASRAAYDFTKESALFQVNPDNCLTFPPVSISKQEMNYFSGTQFTIQDHEARKIHHREWPQMAPMENLKETMNILFTQVQANEHFLLIVIEKVIHALLLFRNHVFDYQNGTPAVDLAFCFLEISFRDQVFAEWNKFLDFPTKQWQRYIHMNKDEYTLLQKVFHHFSKRTSCQITPLSSQTHPYQLLVQHRIDKYFKRAVIYPLYPDPDSLVDLLSHFNLLNQNEMKTEQSMYRDKCSYCGVQSENIKKCTGCYKVGYCSRECQKKDWKKHKPKCQKSAELGNEDSTGGHS